MPSLSPNKTILPKRPQLGMSKSFRSWSAKLSSSSTSAPTENQDLASEVEQRKKGIDSLYTSTEAYWSYLGKKKPVPFDTSSLPILAAGVDDSDSSNVGKPERKMLPVEALGLAMSSFSTAFPESSAYGNCLGLLGEAHLKLGSLQTSFTKDTSHIFLARIARSKATLDSFTAALKKLDSATSRLESAQSKVQKSKKEKRELEEELRLAKAAYDEAVTDVEVRGEAIQEAEYDDWECLTTYMQAQLDYMAQAYAVLDQVKSHWNDVATAPSPLPASSGLRSGSSTPLTRPRSLTGPRSRPSISRRSSAKEATEIATAPGSRFASRSSLSLDRPASVTDETKKEKEKKNRLRMPSFSGVASDTVASVTSGITSGIGSLGRSRGSSLFGSSNNANGNGTSSTATAGAGETSAAEKDSGAGGSSKWNFISRNKKENQGFISMDESERTPAFTFHDDQKPPALPARDKSFLRSSVSAQDVHLGGPHDDVSPAFRFSQHPDSDSNSDSDSHSGLHESPFSPDANQEGFLQTRNMSMAHETIHERGESQMSSEMHMLDSNFLGLGATSAAAASVGGSHLGLNHTGLSAYSDGGDPFSGGAGGGDMMSPDVTGGRYDEDDSDHDDEEEERQGLTGNNEPAGGNSTWRSKLNGSGNGNGNGSGTRGPPPPIPSSASFLSKSKARLAPPPPPPLPSRNSS